MKIAVINETSAADRNADILAALEGRGHEIINAGMRKNGEKPELQYIHTGLLAAILLNLSRVDLVVGGCGTGIGFMNAVVQYPNIVCGHLLTDTKSRTRSTDKPTQRRIRRRSGSNLVWLNGRWRRADHRFAVLLG